MPPGMAALEGQLLIWLIAMIRPGAAFLAAPVFSAAAVPVAVRLIIALAVGIPAIAQTTLTIPADGMASTAGVLLVAGEALAGLAIGFAIQIGFAAALVAGEAISNTMGLGFAAMTDPVNGGATPAIGQFLGLLATFLFLSTNGHLALVGIIAESFRALPPGDAWLSSRAIEGLVRFGGLMFAAGLATALPVGFAMVLVQIVMAIIARATPTLNLFAVGIPATLLAGILLLALALPVMADALTIAIAEALDEARVVGGPSGGA